MNDFLMYVSCHFGSLQIELSLVFLSGLKQKKFGLIQIQTVIQNVSIFFFGVYKILVLTVLFSHIYINWKLKKYACFCLSQLTVTEVSVSASWVNSTEGAYGVRTEFPGFSGFPPEALLSLVVRTPVQSSLVVEDTSRSESLEFGIERHFIFIMIKKLTFKKRWDDVDYVPCS